MEIINIAKDIRSGNLPKEEIPGFAAYMFLKVAWAFIVLAIISGWVVALIK